MVIFRVEIVSGLHVLYRSAEGWDGSQGMERISLYSRLVDFFFKLPALCNPNLGQSNFLVMLAVKLSRYSCLPVCRFLQLINF